MEGSEKQYVSSKFSTSSKMINAICKKMSIIFGTLRLNFIIGLVDKYNCNGSQV